MWKQNQKLFKAPKLIKALIWYKNWSQKLSKTGNTKNSITKKRMKMKVDGN